jgi:hypothetical protein
LEEIMLAVRSIVILACGLAAAIPAQKHPHLDDAGTLQWYTTLASAKAAAKKADRLIFVDYGRTA